MRVTIVAPGFVDTELQGHNANPAVLEGMEKMRSQIGEILRAEDIANAILYAVSQPEHVGINEILVRPTGQRGRSSGRRPVAPPRHAAPGGGRSPIRSLSASTRAADSSTRARKSSSRWASRRSRSNTGM